MSNEHYHAHRTGARAAIAAACKTVFLSLVADIAESMAEAAARQRVAHSNFLAEVLIYECEQREDSRLTFRGHIINTGADSYRLKTTQQ